MNSSYMQLFFFFLPITRLHGDRVTKCHYRSLKHHYRPLKKATIGLNFDFEKIEFQKRDISLINLGNRAKCWIVFKKKAKANFFLSIVENE